MGWTDRFIARRFPKCGAGWGKPPLKGEVSAKRTVGFAAVNKPRWGSGGAVGGADSHLLPRILPSGRALFESLPQPARVGNADRCFPDKSRKTADLGRSNLWRPTVVARTRGSPSRQCRSSIRKESCGFAEFRNFNLWFLNSSTRTRGSQWNRALPGRRQNPRQPESAMPTDVFRASPGKPQNSGTPMYGSRIRHQNPRQLVAVGPADR